MAQKLVLALIATGLCCAFGKTINKIIEESLLDSPDGSGLYTNPLFPTMADDGSILTELDIRVPKEQFEDRMNRLVETTRQGRPKRKGIPEKTRYTDNTRWTDNTMPYTVSGLDYEGMTNLRKAFDIWSHHTCLNFRQRSGYDRNYVQIQNGAGCNSFVGMLGTGVQIMNLGSGCTGVGTILHEIGHAIGLNHEHQRPDRDDYILMRSQYMSPGMQEWGRKTEPDLEDNYGVAYDYGSVMHYGADSFASGTEPTMITHDPTWQFRIGKAQMTSFRDLQIVNIMYKCNAHCGAKTCPEGGFLDKNCQCVCPGNPVTPCGTPAPKVEDDCVDTEDLCGYWRESGMCTSYHSYMIVTCPKACGMCGPGCADYKTDCPSRAQRGECKTNAGYMFQNCMRSCGVCWGTTGSTDCVDRDSNCAAWASQGECDENPVWMRENCPASCDACGGETSSTTTTARPPVTEPPAGCTDNHSQCTEWAGRGECVANSVWMSHNCAKACGKCGGGSVCLDDHGQCAEWAARGECFNNPDWMPQNCRRSCGVC